MGKRVDTMAKKNDTVKEALTRSSRGLARTGRVTGYDQIFEDTFTKLSELWGLKVLMPGASWADGKATIYNECLDGPCPFLSRTSPRDSATPSMFVDIALFRTRNRM